MKKELLRIMAWLLLLGAMPLGASGQSVSAIKNDAKYLWGEGHGNSLNTAEKEAVTNLLSQISQFIKVESETRIINTQTGSVSKAKKSKSDESEVIINTQTGAVASQITHESVMKTYSSVTINNMKRVTWQDGEFDFVLCYVEKTEVDHLFQNRIEKVKEMVEVGHKALSACNIADALRYYYWSYCMLQSLPYPNEVKVCDECKVEQTASVWLYHRICSVLDNLKAEVVGCDESNVCELAFLYGSQPVSSVDYVYYDGQNWVQFVSSARDGRGIVELQPGYQPDYLKLRFEYKYEQDARSDREVEMVLDAVDELGFNRKNEKAIKMGGRNKKETASHQQAVAALQTMDASFAPTSAQLDLSEPLLSKCEQAMQTLVNDIRSENYADTAGMFTRNGHDAFTRLVHYGKARIVETPAFTYSSLAGYVYCRSVLMNFTFSNKRKFVEDVVFVFDANGKVDNVLFGLGKVATNDIFNSNSQWTDEAKNILVTFLENYKTAYALKKRNYLESIFSDDALIIVGNVVKRYENEGTRDLPNYKENKYVKLTRMNKDSYLKNLENVFRRNEYVNIKFANNTMRRMGKGGEVYGIQIKQDYFSTSYGDSGYLFLMVDVNDPNQPIIHVRAWQEEVDPEWGLVGPEMF